MGSTVPGTQGKDPLSRSTRRELVDDVLRRAPLFAALDDEQAAELRASMSEVTLARGDSLFHEGDPGDRLYVVTEGKVKLHRTSPDGRENMLAVARPRRADRRAVPVRPGPAHGDRHRADRGQAAGPGPRRPPALAERAPRGGHRAAARRRPAAAPHQRRDVRPGLLRRPRPRGPRAPGPLAPLRRAVRRGHPRRARPDAGGAGPARRRIARDGQQGAGRLRRRGWLRLEARAVILLDVERLAKRSR